MDRSWQEWKGSEAKQQRFHEAEQKLTQQFPLIRPNEHNSGSGHGTGECNNGVEIMGMSDEGEASGSDNSLEEPLFEGDQEISSGDDGEGRDETDGKDQDDQGGEDASQGEQPQEDMPRAKALTRPVPMTKAQREKHLLEGHAVYHPGCEFCVRTRGLSDRHRRGDKNTREYLEEDDGSPVIGMDFCFLCQQGQEKTSPTLVLKDGRR